MERKKKHTVSGTNVEAVKQENDQSGMSYNEAMEYIARTTGGRGTANYSETDTNAKAIQKKNQQ